MKIMVGIERDFRPDYDARKTEQNHSSGQREMTTVLKNKKIAVILLGKEIQQASCRSDRAQSDSLLAIPRISGPQEALRTQTDQNN